MVKQKESTMFFHKAFVALFIIKGKTGLCDLYTLNYITTTLYKIVIPYLLYLDICFSGTILIVF